MIDSHERKQGDVSSPVFLRRRLSAPETIMRKHMLAQQRSDSQDSEIAHSESQAYRWREETGIGSDISLNKRKEPGFIRKFMLLRRLWGGSKPLFGRSNRLSGSYSEWQYEKISQGRSTQSLNSTLSSPEHLKNRSRHSLSWESEGSPVLRRKFKESPKRQLLRSSFNSNTKMTTGQDNRDILSDNSDTQFIIHQYPKSNGNSNIFTTSYSTEISTEPVNLQDKNGNRPRAINEATQTINTTNLNVISNVQLSQSTLNIIYQQVMQDVSKESRSTSSLNLEDEPIKQPSEEVQVEHMPSFFLKQKEVKDSPVKNRIVKYTLSNVNTGSQYANINEVPQVAIPRFSAIPRTTSMEVNSSSVNYTDKESDEISLVDSLEDPGSPKITSGKDRMKNSAELTRQTFKKFTKPSVFFIPIEKDVKIDTKSVADHLPDKVREKLSRRQLQLEQKRQSKEYDWFDKTDKHSFTILPRINLNKTKQKDKPIVAIDNRLRKPNASSIEKSLSDKSKLQSNNSVEKLKHTYLISKTRQKTVKKLTPLGNQPKKIYHKTEVNNTSKRIEILEIVECMDSSSDSARSKKSKIPILVNQKMPNIPKCRQVRPQKPTYLDFDNFHTEEPKVDQLIANILIEALNKAELHGLPPYQKSKKENIGLEKRPSSQPIQSKPQEKYCQIFEAIPEEHANSNTQNKTIEDNSKGNKDDIPQKLYESNEKLPDCYKGKAAVGVIHHGDNLSIPKGWITFYTLRKSQENSDSTSEEGKSNSSCDYQNDQMYNENKPVFKLSEQGGTSRHHHENFNASLNSETNYQNILSKVDKGTGTRNQWQTEETTEPKTANWTVTVSGTSANTQFAPDLEMRLTFPHVNKQNVSSNQNHSDIKEDYRQHKVEYLERGSRASQTDPFIGSAKTPENVHRLPHIGKSSFKQNKNVCNRKIDLDLLSATSPPPMDFLDFEKNQRNLIEHFPDILSISGNAISPGRKSKPLTMSQKDLTRHQQYYN